MSSGGTLGVGRGFCQSWLVMGYHQSLSFPQGEGWGERPATCSACGVRAGPHQRAFVPRSPQDDEVVLQCSATVLKEQLKLCLAAEGFGNRLCFLEPTSNAQVRVCRRGRVWGPQKRVPKSKRRRSRRASREAAKRGNGRGLRAQGRGQRGGTRVRLRRDLMVKGRGLSRTRAGSDISRRGQRKEGQGLRWGWGLRWLGLRALWGAHGAGRGRAVRFADPELSLAAV